MNIEKIKNEILVNGWCAINLKLNENELINFSRQFGEILPDDNGNSIQYLKPKSNLTGVKDSLSFNFGYSKFPFHTDTAYWSLPARYLVLTSEKVSNCSTYLFDLNLIFNECNAKDLLDLKKSVFLLKTFAFQKFTTLVIQEKETIGIRYDPNIMFPINNSSKRAIKLINCSLEKLRSIEIEWTGENIIVLDNWRIMHSRGDTSNDKERLLKRIYLR